MNEELVMASNPDIYHLVKQVLGLVEFVKGEVEAVLTQTTDIRSAILSLDGQIQTAMGEIDFKLISILETQLEIQSEQAAQRLLLEQQSQRLQKILADVATGPPIKGGVFFGAPQPK